MDAVVLLVAFVRDRHALDNHPLALSFRISLLQHDHVGDLLVRHELLEETHVPEFQIGVLVFELLGEVPVRPTFLVVEGIACEATAAPSHNEAWLQGSHRVFGKRISLLQSDFFRRMSPFAFSSVSTRRSRQV